MILVVDDNDDVRDLACTILDDAGYRVLEAETGERAIVLFEANPDIGLIFTDILMPGIDGFKLADMIRSRRPDIRILYTTAYIGLAREKLGVVHGPILRKPYRPAQLEQLVMESLR
ncbi:MAG: response regulator [Proteobacteria bacterium]|nr:response regulator [Pseudomonadota bacterium]